MWQPIAISQPPPSAWPVMAAITGLGKRSIRRTTLFPNRMNVATSGPENALPRSAPAQKILSPAPVMITHLTSGSSSTLDRAALSSRMSGSLIALAGGRLSVMTAKLSSRLRMIVSYAIRRSPFGLADRSRMHAGERPGIARSRRAPSVRRDPRGPNHAVAAGPT